MSWWIPHSKLIECSLRDSSWDLHSRIPARSRFFNLVWCNLLTSTSPETWTICSDLSNLFREWKQLWDTFIWVGRLICPEWRVVVKQIQSIHWRSILIEHILKKNKSKRLGPLFNCCLRFSLAPPIFKYDCYFTGTEAIQKKHENSNETVANYLFIGHPQTHDIGLHSQYLFIEIIFPHIDNIQSTVYI